MKNCLEKKIVVLEERLQSSKEAIMLQTKEYERRLDLLNGEAERLREMQMTYVPRELYESRHKDLETKLSNLESWKMWVMGFSAAIALGVSFISKELFK